MYVLNFGLQLANGWRYYAPDMYRPHSCEAFSNGDKKMRKVDLPRRSFSIRLSSSIRHPTMRGTENPAFLSKQPS